MADYSRYVDTGADAGGNGTTPAVSGANCAYQSQAQCEAAEDTDLTAIGIITIHCNRTNGGGIDGQGYYYGWTTDDAHYIIVTQDDFPADGIWDDTKYIAKSPDAVYMRQNYGIVHHLQVIAEDGTGIRLRGTGNTAHSCLVKAGTMTGVRIGINIADGAGTIYNCIVSGFNANSSIGIYLQQAGTIKNCTISNCNYGIKHPYSGTSTITNCAVFNNDDDFNVTDGTLTIDHCASDDGDGTNAIDWANEATDWNANFTSYLTGDFSIKDTNADIYHSGTDLDLDVDIIGNPWDASTPSRGAFEYVAGGQTVEASASIAITTTATGTISRNTLASGTVTSSTALSAQASKATTASGAMAISTTLTANALRLKQASSAIAITTSVIAETIRARTVTGTVGITTALTSQVILSRQASSAIAVTVTMAGTSILAVSASSNIAIAVTLSGTASIQGLIEASSSIAISTSLTGAISVNRLVSSSIDIQTSFQASPQLTRLASTLIEILTGFTADASLAQIIQAQAAIPIAVTMSGSLSRLVPISSAIDIQIEMTAAAVRLILVSGQCAIAIEMTGNAVRQRNVLASMDIDVDGLIGDILGD